MADDWRNQRDSFGTLRVPFVFIPEGATAPTDWLTDHPNHIRVPATFVPSRRSRELPEHQRDRSSPVVAPSGDTAPAAANGSFAPVGVRGRRRWPPPPEIDRSGYLREGPVVAYLRANDVFVRMGAVKPDTRHRKAGGTVPLPTAINDQPVQPVYPLEYAIGTAAGGGVLCRPDGVIIRQVLPSLQCTHAPDLIASLSSTDLAASRSNSRTCVQLAANNTNVATDVSPGDNNVQTVANEGTPGSNQAQNAQVRAVVRILGLTRDQQQLHREIAGQDYGFQEILETAKDMFGK